ncbi:MAG TPA: hypothetical protein VKU19_34095 [Bryobacteraceae bacterium]|nr:hypothetical protein [Bryobacteraceae bacterium]
MFFFVKVFPFRVKTEASFTAEDPWNQNRRTPFTVDAYLMLRKGAAPPSGAKPLAGYRYGLRTGGQDAEYMLPDSLSNLWRANRVPTEALPRLLKQMKPDLIKADYHPMLEHPAVYSVLCWITGCLLGSLTLAPVAVWLVTGDFSGSSAAVFALASAVFSVLFLYFLFFRAKRRRTRQMQWILTH